MHFTQKRVWRILQELNGAVNTMRVSPDKIYVLKDKDKNGEYRIFEKDELWGGYDKWAWFKSSFVVPQEYEGKCLVMNVTTGREGSWDAVNPQMLLYVNGKATQGIDTNHTDVVLSESAKAGDVYNFEFEAYSGTPDPRKSTARVLPERLEFRLSFCVRNREVERLYYNISVLNDVLYMCEKTDKLKADLENCLTETVNLIDLRDMGSKEFYESVKVANEYIEREFYDKKCGHSDAIANCIGHTHIDVAWLWTLEQTKHKATRSFSTVLKLMDEYPEYKFFSSQPQLYKYVKEKEPEVYERIKERIAEGRWEADGAMWVEADCNLSGGESLIRQIAHGTQFFCNEFGKRSKILWLPDVFGYSAALPQILKKCGIEYFVTSKISWNEYNRMPYETFNWEGIDGTRIMTQFINETSYRGRNADGFYSTYNGTMNLSEILGGWYHYPQKEINNETLVSFGHGDGGGGVTRKMLEINRRLSKGIPGMPRTQNVSAYEALKSIENNCKDKKRMPSWVGELYLEYHRGTYTSMARNKKYNRKGEFLLEELESLSVFDKLLNNASYPSQFIYDKWETILLNQFHDIIPGSSEEQVYDESKEQYEELFKECNDLKSKKLSAIASTLDKKGYMVYNPTSFVRDEIVEIDGVNQLVTDIPPHGWKVVEKADADTSDTITVTPTHMENDYISIDIDGEGNFTSIFDKKANRELLKEGEKGNVLQAFEDIPHNYDAWDINIYYQEKMWEINDVESIKPLAVDALKGTLEIRKRFMNSTIVQKITIYKNSPKIDFDTFIDWKEKHILLKTSFPLDIVANKATYEIQYGSVERPTHWNTSWDKAKFEVCAHKWADLSEGGYGVALLNDSKYGHDIKDSVMRLTLLKSATAPNPSADREEHSFVYSLLPHNGDWREGNVVKEAYMLNCPTEVVKCEGDGTIPCEYSLAKTTDENVVIEVIKEAYAKDGIIVRVYEAFGKRTNTSLNMARHFNIKKVEETNLLEEEGRVVDTCDGRINFEIKPYEIKTFKLYI